MYYFLVFAKNFETKSESSTWNNVIDRLREKENARNQSFKDIQERAKLLKKEVKERNLDRASQKELKSVLKELKVERKTWQILKDVYMKYLFYRGKGLVSARAMYEANRDHGLTVGTELELQNLWGRLGMGAGPVHVCHPFSRNQEHIPWQR